MLYSWFLKKIPLEYKYKIKSLLGKNRYFDWSDVKNRIQSKSSNDVRVAFMTSSGAHRAGNLLEPALEIALKRTWV